MNEPTDKTKSHLIEFDEPFIEPKAGSAAWMMAPRFLPMMRKAGRSAVVYGLSYAAVKVLDAAAARNPKNEFIQGADQILNVVFGVENLVVSGAAMIVEAGYDALTAPKIEPPSIEAKPKPSLPPKLHHQHRRNHMPLNAALAPDEIQPRPLPKQQQMPKASPELKPQ